MIKNYYVVKAKNDIVRPQRIRFKAANDQTDFNLFQYGNATLPDYQYFDVYINNQKTDQEYTSITFKENDIVTIQLNDNTQYYPYFKCYGGYQKQINVIKELLEPLPLLKLDATTEVTNFKNYFSNCTGLISIPENFFANNTEVTTFSTCFSGCSSLTEIPENIFANNINVTNFSSCFYKCSNLTSIPENLFINNKEVTTFNDCFSSCINLSNIPENLFVNNTEITNLANCFYDCTNLKSFRLKISSPNVTNVGGLISIGSSGTVIVPAGSTTYNTFKTKNISGLTIETF